MTLDAAEFVISTRGREALAFIAIHGGDALSSGTALRKSFPDVPPTFLAAASEVYEARKRARGKFAQADRMFLTREALEQASDARVALHRAERFKGLGCVCDACCGIGGDAIGLGGAVGKLVCVDMDPARLIFCEENLRIHNIGARFIRSDIRDLTVDMGPFEAIFIDPSRRTGGKRTLDPRAMEPPLDIVLDILARFPRGAAKLPTSIRSADIPMPHEFEWVSTEDGLKEATLWTGDFRRAATSVTLIHRGARLCDTDLPDAEPDLGEGQFLHEPDPALIRSGLLGRKAASLGMRLLDRSIAYTFSDSPVRDPFFTSWRVLRAFPFGMKRLERELADLDAGTVTIKKRGFPLEPEEVVRSLRLAGSTALTAVITRTEGGHRAYIVEREM